jgi:hypothetical protein
MTVLINNRLIIINKMKIKIKNLNRARRVIKMKSR